MGFLEQAAQGYTSNKFVDPAKAMGGNFLQQMYTDVAAKNAAKRNKEAAVKNKVSNYIDNIDTNVDQSGLTETMRSKTNNVLSNVRMELVDTINQLSRMEPGTEEYIMLNDRRNYLMEIPKKMEASIKSYNDRKAEYLDDVDSDRVSLADADGNDLASVSAIWSMPPYEASQMPLSFFLSFFKNHGLFKLKDRPQWYTVTNRSKTYVDKILSKINGEYYMNYGINKITSKA